MQDRRETDKIILEELRDLKKDVGVIQINLALNTNETSRLAKYQEFQNGRVATQESRMQIVETAQAVTSTAVAKMQISDDKQSEKKTNNTSKAWWIAIGIGLSILGSVMNYLIRTDVLKEIFK